MSGFVTCASASKVAVAAGTLIIGCSAVAGVACGICNGCKRGSSNACSNSSQQILKPARNIPEYDFQVRRCEIKLYTRPIKDHETLTSFHHSLQHWEFLCCFEEDEIYRTIQGFKDENGMLDAYILKYKVAPSTNGKYYDLGVIEKSPAQLRELALANPLNETKYYPSTNSCQNWAKKYAELISDDIAKKVNKFWTLKGVNPIFSYFWTYTEKICNFCAENLKKLCTFCAEHLEKVCASCSKLLENVCSSCIEILRSITQHSHMA